MKQRAIQLNPPPPPLINITLSGQPAISTGVVNLAALLGSADYLLVRSISPICLSNSTASDDEDALNLDSSSIIGTDQSTEYWKRRQLRLCNHTGLPLGCFFVESGGNYEVVRRKDVELGSIPEINGANEKYVGPYSSGVREDSPVAAAAAAAAMKRKRENSSSLPDTCSGDSENEDGGAVGEEVVREEQRQETVHVVDTLVFPPPRNELSTPLVGSCTASNMVNQRRFPPNDRSRSSSREDNSAQEELKMETEVVLNAKKNRCDPDSGMKTAVNMMGFSEAASVAGESKPSLPLGRTSTALSNGFLDWVCGRDDTYSLHDVEEDESMPDDYNDGNRPSTGTCDGWVPQESPALGFTYVENTLSQDFSLGSSSVTSSVEYA